MRDRHACSRSHIRYIEIETDGQGHRHFFFFVIVFSLALLLSNFTLFARVALVSCSVAFIDTLHLRSKCR